MHVQIGAQDAGEHGRVAGVGLPTGFTVTLSVAHDGSGVDRVIVNPAAVRAVTTRFLSVSMGDGCLPGFRANLRKEFEQLGEPGQVRAHPSSGQDSPHRQPRPRRDALRPSRCRT